MFKIKEKAPRLILAFAISFMCALIVIKIKNVYFSDIQKITDINKGSPEEKFVNTFPKVSFPEGAKEFFSRKGKQGKDSGRVKVFMYNCPQSLKEVKSFYTEKMPLSGWQLDKEASDKVGDAMKMESLVFRKGNFLCYMELEEFKESGGTALVIQMVASPVKKSK